MSAISFRAKRGEICDSIFRLKGTISETVSFKTKRGDICDSTCGTKRGDICEGVFRD